MMKSLLLVRHAKSGWDPTVPGDFQRTLNDRGRKDAPAMARRLIADQQVPDLLVSSPAFRARETCELFAGVFKMPASGILFIENLYEPTIEAFFAAVAGLPNEVSSAAIFSHNPGITDFANRLTATKIDDMPTCSVFAVRVAGASWREFREADREFWFFKYPNKRDE